MHKISELYKKIYENSNRISKQDRFGLYLKIENTALKIFDSCLEASLSEKSGKIPPLNSARINTEKLKRLIRIAFELKIIDNKRYLNFQSDLQEISKMINGWIKYLK